MTGTVDSSTTLRIRPAPPRGMRTSTRPRARISTFAPSCPSPGTSWTASASSPAPAIASRSTPTIAVLLASALAEPRSSAALPDFRQMPAASAVTFGPRLVDDPDHAERHPHLAQLQAVGQGPAPHHLADGVGQPGHVAQPLGHAGDPVLVEAEPVDDVAGDAGGLRAPYVLGVRGQHLVTPGDQRVGHREERRVLLARGSPGRARSSPRGRVRRWP